jgi:NAD(P)-dependent dehydrogenase (short-subunit alcohol dehydrogenase family)
MTSTASLAGKRVLITGGSRGIGAAIVRRLASQGATVAVNYRSDRAAADALVGELRDNGCAASAFPADVSDVAQTHELVGAVVSEFGGLDLLVSNPGVEHFGARDQRGICQQIARAAAWAAALGLCGSGQPPSPLRASMSARRAERLTFPEAASSWVMITQASSRQAAVHWRVDC